MRTEFFMMLCLLGCSAILVKGQVNPKADAKPVKTQTATTRERRSVILKSDGTWSYETYASASMFTLTGKCRFQLIKGFVTCSPKVVFVLTPDGVSHITCRNDAGKQIIFDLAGRSDRQPHSEDYYLQINTFGLAGLSKDGVSDDGMDGECRFRTSKSGKIFYFVTCDISNREKGTTHNFYLENITRSDRQIIK